MELKKEPLIIAIESSCDDTSVAVLRGNKVLSNVVATQDVHKEYGGVVPELASRAHQKNIIPTFDTALKKAGVSIDDLDAIAFTRGPGLLGSLLVGVSFAKSIGLSMGIPLIEVNHMKAHILAHLIDDESARPGFPFLCLTVSGGHTQLVRLDDPYQFEVLGETIDDAAGEAFDKISKIMGLPYPGGPVLDKLAKEGNSEAFQFTLPRVDAYNYSFSGLKTAVLYFLQKEVAKDPDFVEKNKADLCASVQKAILDVLFVKLEKLVQESGIHRVAIAGGVSANSGLRQRLQSREGWETFIPAFQFCTDNAAMIGIAAYYQYLAGNFSDLSVVAEARLKIS